MLRLYLREKESLREQGWHCLSLSMQPARSRGSRPMKKPACAPAQHPRKQEGRPAGTALRRGMRFGAPSSAVGQLPETQGVQAMQNVTVSSLQ